MLRRSIVACLTIAIVFGCRSKPDEPQSRVTGQPVASSSQPETLGTGPDPMNGQFTLQQATDGLEGQGTLRASIKTAKGTLECELLEDKAPIAVANFVGLARGIRPFRGPGREWVKKPAYDGTVFHRVAPGFMIQGGDWKKNGTGSGGYEFVDEVWAGAKHDRAGQLCMANRGANTNSMQFFITDGAAPHLDGGYTIFGQCSPESIISEIANVPARGDRAIDPVVIRKVTVSRGPATSSTSPDEGSKDSTSAASATSG